MSVNFDICNAFFLFYNSLQLAELVEILITIMPWRLFTYHLQRDNVIKSFRAGKIWILICTELMGRGIDFKGVNLVLNYDFPNSAISYIHRIGQLLIWLIGGCRKLLWNLYNCRVLIFMDVCVSSAYKTLKLIIHLVKIKLISKLAKNLLLIAVHKYPLFLQASCCMHLM